MPSLVGSEMCIRDRCIRCHSDSDRVRRCPVAASCSCCLGRVHTGKGRVTRSSGRNCFYRMRRHPLFSVLGLRTEGPESVRGLSLIHISEPTRLGMISYAVFCLKKKKHKVMSLIHILRMKQNNRSSAE